MYIDSLSYAEKSASGQQQVSTPDESTVRNIVDRFIDGICFYLTMANDEDESSLMANSSGSVYAIGVFQSDEDAWRLAGDTPAGQSHTDVGHDTVDNRYAIKDAEMVRSTLLAFAMHGERLQDASWDHQEL